MIINIFIMDIILLRLDESFFQLFFLLILKEFLILMLLFNLFVLLIDFCYSSQFLG